MTKECRSCKILKSFNQFIKDKSMRNNCGSYCKSCYKIIRREHGRLPEVKKRKAELRKIRNLNKIKTEEQKLKDIEYKRKWYLKNKERLTPIYKKYRQTHRQQINTYFRERKKRDPLFKMKCNLRSRLWEYLNRRNFIKGCKFSDYLGCSIEKLKIHLESQFSKGMTWKNHGEWEIDHIVELNTATNEEQMYKLCHYTNLQPLWAKDNISKSNRLCHRK